jgi:hypothetical protein
VPALDVIFAGKSLLRSCMQRVSKLDGVNGIDMIRQIVNCVPAISARLNKVPNSMFFQKIHQCPTFFYCQRLTTS